MQHDKPVIHVNSRVCLTWFNTSHTGIHERVLNARGRQASEEWRRLSHTDSFEARDFVSDWLNQTCCKERVRGARKPNKTKAKTNEKGEEKETRELAVILLQGYSKVAHRISFPSNACDMTSTRSYGFNIL